VGVERRPGCRRESAARRGAARARGAHDERGEGGEGGLRAENERLRAEVVHLRARLEVARRAWKRQAAPFSKGDPKPDPKRSGRRSGADYGTRARRPIPERVDEEVEVPLPEGCPCCGGELELERVAEQYQEDIVAVRAHVRRYRVAVGRCRGCGARVQGRHREQTSDALGAAASQIGPHALALAAHLNKELGLAVAKAARVLREIGGLEITPGGLHRALQRLARAAEPTYGALVEAVGASPVVAPDETGWRVGGVREWLWAFVGAGVTVYLIAPGRGYEQACVVLGADYAGVLERDGWAPYRRFEHARHQSCLAHLLRRASEMIADSRAGQARIPHAVRRLLLDALALRDAHREALAAHRRQDDADVIEGTAVEILPGGGPAAEPERRPLPAAAAGPSASASEAIEGAAAESESAAVVASEAVAGDALAAGRAALQARLDQLLARNPTHAPNRRLLRHLASERDHLLTFLELPGVEATNWRAEQAIRPAVVNRKAWGGNRTRRGADTQQVLMSVIRTARQHDADPIALLGNLLRQRNPRVSDALRLPAQPPSPTANGPAPARGP
jgi:transposase